jgi:NADPH2:quinone reductase
LVWYVNTGERLQAMADELFQMVAGGKIEVEIEQRYPLADAAAAQQALAARQTTGSTVLLP